jgi:hypothetical protein
MTPISSAIRHPAFFNRYVEQVEPGKISGLLFDSVNLLERDLKIISSIDSTFAYAPGKWSINTLLRHCIDAEMIFAFRALSIARQDPHPIRSFEENQYAIESEKSYDVQLLVQEFVHVRSATALLFKSFDEDWLSRSGITDNGEQISLLSIGYIIIGHWLHHRKILQTKYGVVLGADS